MKIFAFICVQISLMYQTTFGNPKPENDVHFHINLASRSSDGKMENTKPLPIDTDNEDEQEHGIDYASDSSDCIPWVKSKHEVTTETVQSSWGNTYKRGFDLKDPYCKARRYVRCSAECEAVEIWDGSKKLFEKKIKEIPPNKCKEMYQIQAGSNHKRSLLDKKVYRIKAEDDVEIFTGTHLLKSSIILSLGETEDPSMKYNIKCMKDGQAVVELTVKCKFFDKNDRETEKKSKAWKAYWHVDQTSTTKCKNFFTGGPKPSSPYHIWEHRDLTKKNNNLG